MSEYTLFAKRIGLVGLTKFIGSLRGIILLPVLAKTLGAANYGIWSQILITLGLLMPFVTLSLPSAMVRFLPAEKEKQRLAQGIFTSLFTIFFISLIFALLLFFFSQSFAKIFLQVPAVSYLIKIASLLIILEALNQAGLEPFRILGQIRRYSALSIFQTILEIGLISSLVLSNFGLLGAIVGLLITRAAILLFSLIFVISQTGFALPRFSLLPSYLIFGLPLLPIGVLDILIASSDRYVIGFFKGAAEVGIYSATYNLGVLAGVFIFPISYILSPTIFKLFDEKKIEKVKTYLSYSLKYFLCLAIPSTFGLTLLSQPLLKTLTSSEFVSFNTFLIVFLVALGMIFYGLQAIFGQVLMLRKKTRFFLFAFGLGAFINLGLNILLVPSFGILGAAFTTLVAYLLVLIAIYWKTYWQLKFKINFNFILKSVLASLVMAGVIYLLSPAGIVQILLIVVFATLVYFVILFLLKGFQKKEIQILQRMLQLKKPL